MREIAALEWTPNVTNATDQGILQETAKKSWTDVTDVMVQDILLKIVSKIQMKILATHVESLDTLLETAQRGIPIHVISRCHVTNVMW